MNLGLQVPFQMLGTIFMWNKDCNVTLVFTLTVLKIDPDSAKIVLEAQHTLF